MVRQLFISFPVLFENRIQVAVLENATGTEVLFAHMPFVKHPAFFHDATGTGVVHRMMSFNPLKAYRFKSKVDNSLYCFAHDAMFPPFFTQTIAKIPNTGFFVEDKQPNSADRYTIQRNRPMVVVRLLVQRHPAFQNRLSDLHRSVRLPHHKLSNIRVTCPVVIHCLCIRQIKGAQDQTGGFKCSGTNMI